MERWRRARRQARVVAERYMERDLLSYASAIAFQVLYALVPCLLAGIALLAFLGLEETWRADLRPRVRDTLPADAFGLVDRTVRRILTEKRVTWLTFGVAFALWQLSSAVRAAMGPLNTIYAIDEQRSTARRLFVSLALSVAIAPLLVIAVAAIGVADDVVRPLDLGFASGAALVVARYGIGVAALLVAVWLVLRFAPGRSGGAGWVSAGSLTVVAGWLVTSFAYAFYVGDIASYRSLFGALASVIVLMSYLYLLAVVFLAGAQLDAVVREQDAG